MSTPLSNLSSAVSSPALPPASAAGMENFLSGQYPLPPSSLSYSPFNNANHQAIASSTSSKSQKQCQWANCNELFQNNRTLISHLKEHVGRKGPYTCEWRGCPQQSEPYTNRNNMMVHLRTHTTGEKVRQCPVGGCDQTFVRLDAFQKHVSAHGINPASLESLNSVSTPLEAYSQSPLPPSSTMFSNHPVPMPSMDRNQKPLVSIQPMHSNLSMPSTVNTSTSSLNPHRYKYHSYRARLRYLESERDAMQLKYAEMKKRARRLRLHCNILLESLVDRERKK